MRVSSIEPSQSCHAICQIVRPFLGLLSSLFSLIESEISEEASRQVVPSSGEEDYVSFLPTLLLCSSRFLRALQQNRAQSRLLYLLNRTVLEFDHCNIQRKERIRDVCSFFHEEQGARCLN